MVFRTKFEKIGWITVGLAGLNIALDPGIVKDHKFSAESAFWVACWCVVIFFSIYARFFRSLELDSGYLRKRDIFKTTTVSLAEVTRVKGLGFSNDLVQVEFRHPMSLAKSKSIVVHPNDRTDFVSAMRQFAPQATFE